MTELPLQDTRLFQHFVAQDQAAIENISSSDFLRYWVELASEVIALGCESLLKMPFRGDKEQAVATLAMDALSNVLVAIRVGLWGNVPESLCILRTSIERCAQLEFVVHEKKYQTAMHEMDHKFAEISFEGILKRLGTRGNKIQKLHGLISQTASHATSGSLRWNSYERNGKRYIRLALARNPSLAELPVFYAMDVCISIVNAIRSAYLQDGLEYPWEQQWGPLSKRYVELNHQYVQKVKEVTPS